MTKKHVLNILLIAFFVGAAGGIVFQRFVIPFLSTVPGLGGLSKLQANSPIVVTRYEQVQLNEGVNLIELTKQAQANTVSIYAPDLSLRGSGVVMTSDGLIFTSKEVIGNLNEFTVVLNDGNNHPGVLRALDPHSELAVISIPANNLAVAQLADAQALQTAQRIFALGKTNHEFTRLFVSGLITKTVTNSLQPNKIYSTEVFEETINTDAEISADFIGGPVINLEGKLVGMVVNSNGKILIAEAIQGALRSYLDQQKIIRPVYGIKFNSLSKNTAQLRELGQAGALVTDVDRNSAAEKAGLLRSDLIVEVNGQRVADSSLEQVLSKATGQIKLKIIRAGQDLELTLNPEFR